MRENNVVIVFVCLAYVKLPFNESVIYVSIFWYVAYQNAHSECQRFQENWGGGHV